MENELKINEVEATKLNLQPGQVLIVKVYADDTSQNDLAQLRSQLKVLFPNNKIMLFALPSGGKIEMDVLDLGGPIVQPAFANPVSMTSPCAEPASYCNDCACGKKERIEGKK